VKDTQLKRRDDFVLETGEYQVVHDGYLVSHLRARKSYSLTSDRGASAGEMMINRYIQIETVVVV
jgi:hypothetical protein